MVAIFTSMLVALEVKLEIRQNAANGRGQIPELCVYTSEFLGVGQYLYLLLFTYPREVLKIHLFIIGFRF